VPPEIKTQLDVSIVIRRLPDHSTVIVRKAPPQVEENNSIGEPGNWDNAIEGDLDCMCD
jgi:hypothetical protein